MTKSMKRILVIDDNKTDVEIIKKMLSDDYQIETASDGETGLKMITENPPELILLDIMLPQMDGYEICRRIRADRHLCHIKVIMVSGKTSSGDRLEGYNAGADGFIIKPYAKEELLAQVRVFIRLKSTEEIEQIKSNVLNLISHEIKAPLSNIITPAKTLTDGSYIPEKKRDLMASWIYMYAKRLNNLFEKIFMLVEMKCERWNYQFEEIDLSDIVDDAVNSFRKEIQGRSVSLIIDCSCRPIIWADQKMLKMVLESIFNNAVKFSQNCPCIDIKVELIGNATDAFVSITDHGKGIAPELLHNVFDEFTVDGKGNHSAGHGLNMPIANQIALSHNGVIVVTSNPGFQTTFTLRLPVAEDTQLEETEANAAVMTGTACGL